ncbi:MAG: hypothetical protein ACK46Q_08555 [Hyphomonas sp.]
MAIRQSEQAGNQTIWGNFASSINDGTNWGDAYSIDATLVVWVFAYAALQAGQATEALCQSHEKQLTDIRADLVSHRRSIQQLKISDARNSERYEALSRSMEELKAAQRETNELLRRITSGRGG